MPKHSRYRLAAPVTDSRIDCECRHFCRVRRQLAEQQLLLSLFRRVGLVRSMPTFQKQLWRSFQPSQVGTGKTPYGRRQSEGLVERVLSSGSACGQTDGVAPCENVQNSRCTAVPQLSDLGRCLTDGDRVFSRATVLPQRWGLTPEKSATNLIEPTSVTDDRRLHRYPKPNFPERLGLHGSMHEQDRCARYPASCPACALGELR
jgi:hypothetical protein